MRQERWRDCRPSFKCEGRPSDGAILAGRMIDRPLRPLFPSRYGMMCRWLWMCCRLIGWVIRRILLSWVLPLHVLWREHLLEVHVLAFASVLWQMKMEGSNLLWTLPMKQVEQGRLDLMVAGTKKCHHHDWSGCQGSAFAYISLRWTQLTSKSKSSANSGRIFLVRLDHVHLLSWL